MKFVLILFAMVDAINSTSVATTAVFDDEFACAAAITAAKRLSRRFEGVCIPQASAKPPQ